MFIWILCDIQNKLQQKVKNFFGWLTSFTFCISMELYYNSYRFYFKAITVNENDQILAAALIGFSNWWKEVSLNYVKMKEMEHIFNN